jgi:hypothetical protein
LARLPRGNQQERVLAIIRRFHLNKEGLGTDQGITLEKIRDAIAEDKNVLQDIYQQEAQGKPDKQHTWFRPLKPEVKFKFSIFFENLSDAAWPPDLSSLPARRRPKR